MDQLLSVPGMLYPPFTHVLPPPEAVLNALQTHTKSVHLPASLAVGENDDDGLRKLGESWGTRWAARAAQLRQLPYSEQQTCSAKAGSESCLLHGPTEDGDRREGNDGESDAAVVAQRGVALVALNAPP